MQRFLRTVLLLDQLFEFLLDITIECENCGAIPCDSRNNTSARTIAKRTSLPRGAKAPCTECVTSIPFNATNLENSDLDSDEMLVSQRNFNYKT